MVPLRYLICVLYLYTQGYHGQIILTQTPDYISVSPGDKVTLSCKPSETIFHPDWKYNALAWFQQKPGEAPKLLVYKVNVRKTGIPERFIGSGDGTDNMLTIHGVAAEDEAGYYCMQYKSYPLTFGDKTTVEIKRGSNVKPSASVYPPSKDQILTGFATPLCLVSSFYPGDATVDWKVDQKTITENVKNSEKTKDSDNTYSMSSSLNLSADQYNKGEVYTCVVTHSTLTSPMEMSFKRSECSA